jgi:hypothetical protein
MVIWSKDVPCLCSGFWGTDLMVAPVAQCDGCVSKAAQPFMHCRVFFLQREHLLLTVALLLIQSVK